MAFFVETAYSFDSDLSISAMLPVLNKLGLWLFVERDNDRWGFYIVSNAGRPEVAAVHIIQPWRRYSVNIRYESTDPRAPEDWAKMFGELYDRILPAIGARDIQVTEYDERAPPNYHEYPP